MLSQKFMNIILMNFSYNEWVSAFKIQGRIIFFRTDSSTGAMGTLSQQTKADSETFMDGFFICS